MFDLFLEIDAQTDPIMFIAFTFIFAVGFWISIFETSMLYPDTIRFLYLGFAILFAALATGSIYVVLLAIRA